MKTSGIPYEVEATLGRKTGFLSSTRVGLAVFDNSAVRSPWRARLTRCGSVTLPVSRRIFCALYGEFETLIDIRTLEIIKGGLPRRALALVLE